MWHKSPSFFYWGMIFLYLILWFSYFFTILDCSFLFYASLRLFLILNSSLYILYIYLFYNSRHSIPLLWYACLFICCLMPFIYYLYKYTSWSFSIIGFSLSCYLFRLPLIYNLIIIFLSLSFSNIIAGLDCLPGNIGYYNGNNFQAIMKIELITKEIESL